MYKRQGLHSAFKFYTPHLIEHEGKDNGEREVDGEGKYAQNQGVGDKASGVIAGKEAGKVFETHPGGAPEAFYGVVVPEGDLQAVHGGIVEDDIVGDNWQKQQVDLPVLCKGEDKPFTLQPFFFRRQTYRRPLLHLWG